jgi:hypothetical protein
MTSTKALFSRYDQAIIVAAILIAVCPIGMFGQVPLQTRVAAIARDAHGTVSVACVLPGEFGNSAWPTSAVCFGPPLGR